MKHLTFEDDSRVELLPEVTIEIYTLTGSGETGSIWAGGASLPESVGEQVGLAAQVLKDYLAGTPRQPTEAEITERKARKLADSGPQDPDILRRAADIIEAERAAR